MNVSRRRLHHAHPMTPRHLSVTGIAMLLAASILVAGCQPTATEPVAAPNEPAPTMPPKGTVVFDMGHGEIFGAEDTSELGQSQAIERIRSAGFDVVINQDTITEEDLAFASGLIIAGPMRPLQDEEYDVITAFAERGGTVLLTIHVPFPVLKVPAHWGLPVGTEIMMSKRPIVSPDEPSVFAADNIEEGRITEGVGQVVVVSGWPVGVASEDAALVVKTGDDTWLAEGGDAQPEAPDDAEYGSFGVVGVSRIGEGLVVVSGDDAIFANMALGAGDNARLLDNIIALMSEMAEV